MVLVRDCLFTQCIYVSNINTASVYQISIQLPVNESRLIKAIRNSSYIAEGKYFRFTNCFLYWIKKSFIYHIVNVNFEERNTVYRLFVHLLSSLIYM